MLCVIFGVVILGNNVTSDHGVKMDVVELKICFCVF